MKKSLFNTVMALCIGLFASCSQEEIISQTASGEVEAVSIDAQLPKLAGTRALPGAEANHQLRCILEVWDKAEGGKLITRIEKLASAANEGGKLQFSFTVPTATNYQCLLWADFIAADAATSTTENGNTTYTDKYFNTTNLKAIDFKVADATLFNNVSTDAFCGTVSKNGTTSQLSVTLKRPFTKVTLTDKSDYITGCTALGVEYLTPSGYNIANGTTTTTKPVKATGLAPNGKAWFSTFIFASADKQKLDQDITMNVTKADGKTEKKTIKKGQISLDSNVENNAEANFSADDDVNIDVDVDPEFPDPNALKIGQFVNKDGSVSDTYDAANAIGIVFAAAKGKSDISNYGEAFADKKIAGYAMALTSVTEQRQYLGKDANDVTAVPELAVTGADAWNVSDYSGYQYTQTLLPAYQSFTSTIFTSYNTWLTANTIPVSTANLSSWYIPSARQALDLIGSAIGFAGDTNEKEVASFTRNATIEAAFLAGQVSLFTKKDPTNMMSSYIGKANSMSAVQVGYKPTEHDPNINCPATDKNGETHPLQTPAATAKSFFNIRPVLTIFK